MHRSIETVDRPEPHVFALSPDGVCCASVALSRSQRPAVCGLPKKNAVHVSPGEVYSPTPEGDFSDRMIGEGDAA